MSSSIRNSSSTGSQNRNLESSESSMRDYASMYETYNDKE